VAHPRRVVSGTRHERLEDVILDDLFPEVDLALRRGRHIDRDDADWYAFVIDAQDHLELLYRRYGCELVHKTEGYFYLLPTNDRLGRRFLSAVDMLVGQALALLYLDPANVQAGGVVTREQLLGHLAGIMGTEALVRAVAPAKRKKQDQRVAEENARSKIAESVRRLGSLGFVELIDETTMRLRPALMRFAEPVRGTAAPEENLGKLVARGEVILTAEDAEPEADAELETDTEPDPEPTTSTSTSPAPPDPDADRDDDRGDPA
jgi:chromosome partition protein MukE